MNKYILEPLVTIYCLTYNHVDYIKDTFEGFLHQKTNFKFKIFVFDDASNDGTSEIIKTYAKKYPDIFDVYISPINTYNSPKRCDLMRELFGKHIEGKYVAWCEGDDYWLDLKKLQLQVDFMETHQNTVMTAHSSEWINYLRNSKYEYRPYKEDRYLTAEEVIMQPYGNLTTASLVMRKDVFMREKEYPKCDVEDIPLQLSALNKGDIYYFDRVMSVYRYMHEGSWSQRTDKNFYRFFCHQCKMVEFFEEYNSFTHFKYEKWLWRKIVETLYSLVFYNINLNTEEFNRYCEEINTKSKCINKNINKIKMIFAIAKGEYIFDEDEKKTIIENKHIVVMGTGVFSKYLIHTLKNNNIDFDGYVVSNDQQLAMNTRNGKKIWKLCEYPYGYSNTLILVGIKQNIEEEIVKSLKDNLCENYMMPLWFQE